MARRMQIARAASGLGLAALAALPIEAQENGGQVLSFGISFRVDSQTNPSLSVPAEPSTNQIASRLTFGLTDVTRTGAVSLFVAGTLSADNDETSEDGLIDPDLALSLQRFGAGSEIELSAFLRETNLNTLRRFVIDPDGNIAQDFVGNGTQRQNGGEIAYSFGEDGPWGGSLFAGLTDTTFSGDTTEADYTRNNLGGTLRFSLDPATDVVAGLVFSRYDQEGEAPRETLRPELGFRRDRPAGFVAADVFAENTEDGVRAGVSFGQGWERPGSSFAYSLGATRDVSGELSPTGSLNWQRELPRGNVFASLSHEVTSGFNDEETIITTVSLGLNQAVSPLGSVFFGLDASDSDDVLTDDNTQNASVSAIYSHSLPYDWMLDAGVTHRVRNEDDTGDATSDTVFLELRRDIEWQR